MRAGRAQRRRFPWRWVVLVALALALCAVTARFTMRPDASRGEWFSAGLAQPAGAAGAASSAAATPRPAPATLAATVALPPGPVHGRVGLQVGHWESAELPDELAVLRGQQGAESAGLREVDVNYAVARQAAALLRARGVTVDLLPATVPPGYRADAFVAVHCDVNGDPAMRGYKLARFSGSAIPQRDDILLETIGTRYAAATGQPRDLHVTAAMTGYYAFNSRDFVHAIDPQTPAVIIELGFLTNPEDRELLKDRQDLLAAALADGILRYLMSQGQ